MFSLSPDYLPGKVWPAHGERLQKRRHCSFRTRCIQVSMFAPLIDIFHASLELDCPCSLQMHKKINFTVKVRLIFGRKSAGAPMIVEVN